MLGCPMKKIRLLASFGRLQGECDEDGDGDKSNCLLLGLFKNGEVRLLALLALIRCFYWEWGVRGLLPLF